MLEIALRHRQGGFTLDLDLNLPGRGVTSLFGPSGAGKSTVLQAVAGLIRPRDGRIALDGRVFLDSATGVVLAPERRRIGYVFQDARLFPHLGVRDNLRYGLRRAPPDRRPVTEDAVVELLGLAGLLERRTTTLSGGERQRVALGRALLAQPDLLLLDEPLAALDAPRKAEILPYLERLRDGLALPILHVSHAVDEVCRLADTLVVLKAGRVRACGPLAEVLARPDLGEPLGGRDRGTVLAATVLARDTALGLTRFAVGGTVLSTPALELAVGTTVRLRILARDVAVALTPPDTISILNCLPATLRHIRPVGSGQADLELVCDGFGLTARITAASVAMLGLGPGQPLHALVKAVAVEGVAG